MYLDPNSKEKWRWLLQDAAWTLNTSYHTALKMTPYEAMFGEPPPIDALGIPVREHHFDKFPLFYGMRRKQLMEKRRQLQESVAKARNTSIQHHNTHSHKIPYKVGDYVLYKNNRAKKWDEKYFGPWKIIRQISPVVFELHIDGERFTAHAAYLKPYRGTIVNPPTTVNLDDDDPGEDACIDATSRFIQGTRIEDPVGDSLGLETLFNSPDPDTTVQPYVRRDNSSTPPITTVRQAIHNMRRMINFRKPAPQSRKVMSPHLQPQLRLHRVPDQTGPMSHTIPAAQARAVTQPSSADSRPQRDRRPVTRYGDFVYGK
jgi:hypothetical protein